MYTDDLTLAALLRCHGVRLHMKLPDTAGDKVQWGYEDTEEIQEVVDAYLRGLATVEPRQFMRELRYARSDLYALLGYNPRPLAAS